MLAGPDELSRRGERHVYMQKGENKEERSFTVPGETSIAPFMSLQSLRRGTTALFVTQTQCPLIIYVPQERGCKREVALGENILAGVDASIPQHLDCSPGHVRDGLIPEWPRLAQRSSQAHSALLGTLFLWLIKPQARITPRDGGSGVVS